MLKKPFLLYQLEIPSLVVISGERTPQRHYIIRLLSRSEPLAKHSVPLLCQTIESKSQESEMVLPMDERLKKVEDSIKFLTRELEAQNLAISRIEQKLDGTPVGGQEPSPVAGQSDHELRLMSIESQLAKHHEVLKNNTIATVGLNDLLESIRDYYRESVKDIRFDQQTLMQTFQKILAGSMEELRTELLLALRDFREKYPLLEQRKIEQELVQSRKKGRQMNEGKAWTADQQKDLERLSDDLEKLVDRFVNEAFNSQVELLSYLLNKVEELSLHVKEQQIK